MPYVVEDNSQQSSCLHFLKAEIIGVITIDHGTANLDDVKVILQLPILTLKKLFMDEKQGAVSFLSLLCNGTDCHTFMG